LAVVDDTLYAGGNFLNTSGVAGTNSIAAWSTIDDTWSPLGSGVALSDPLYLWVRALAVVDDTVYAAGNFTSASGVAANNIAGWSTIDDTWSALGAGFTGNDIRALAVSSDDTVYAGGGAPLLAAWSDGIWSALGAGVNADVQALALRDDTLYAGGTFTTASGVAVNRIAAWSDDTWSALGSGMNNVVFALAVASDGTVYAGGGFTTASGVAGTRKIAAWSDDTWSALGAGMSDWVYALAIDDARRLVYAGGDFITATAGGAAITLDRVGVWDAGIAEWIPFSYASGIGVGSTVYSLTVDGSMVYLGGAFTDAGGVAAADHIARWTWEPPQGSNTLDTTVGASVTLTGEGFIGVPATGGVKVGSTVAAYTRDDSATITMTVPAGSFTNAPITVDGVGGWGEVGVLSVPAPPAPTPAGPPTDVAGVAGDASVQVRWAAPTSTGSFPVTNYQVMSSPSGGMCLTTTLACEVSGLANGVDYTFTVRALTGAGWSSWSAPSEVVTPQRPVDPSIMITGSRGEVRGKPGVVVSGTSTGLGMGAILAPWTRTDNRAKFTEGRARILVDMSGEFTWQRRSKQTVRIQMRTPDGAMTSNTLTIAR
jgi:hypothetical protein